jgi:hypothetical protein
MFYEKYIKYKNKYLALKNKNMNQLKNQQGGSLNINIDIGNVLSTYYYNYFISILKKEDFNYENNKYLKKYIKHRVEEIVELNKLLDTKNPILNFND